VDEEDPLSACPVDFVVVDIVIDVVWALEDQVAVETA
jgi:hypothetical protein